MFLKRSVFVILLMVSTGFFFINASYGSGKKDVQSDPFLKDYITDFRTVLNSKYVKYEELKRLRPIDIMVNLIPITDAIVRINTRLWSMTPQYFRSLNKYERVALLINIYNLKVFTVALEYQGDQSYDKMSPHYLDSFFFESPSYSRPCILLQDDYANTLELSLKDLVNGIMLGDRDYIAGIEDETKREGILAYNYELDDIFYRIPGLLFLLASYTKQTPGFSDLPKDRTVKDAVFLFEPLEKVYSKFLGDKKRGRIEFDAKIMYDRIIEKSGDSDADTDTVARLWVEHKMGLHNDIVELKKLRFPYFFKLYEKPFLSQYGSWTKVVLAFSKDKRLIEFLEKNLDAQFEVEFKTNPKLLGPN